MDKKIGYGLVGFVGVVLAVFAGHYLYALATGARYTDGEWSAAAAWFGGIATFAAVVVALRQAKGAREDAEEAKHEARELLSRQLEQQLRNAQFQAIQDCVDSVDHLMSWIERVRVWMFHPAGQLLILLGGDFTRLDSMLQRMQSSSRVAQTYITGTPLTGPLERYVESARAYAAAIGTGPGKRLELLRDVWTHRRNGGRTQHQRHLRSDVKRRGNELLEAAYLHCRQGAAHDPPEGN